MEFWFALRDLAREQLSDLDRVVADLIGSRDPLTPLTRDELAAAMSTGEVVLIDVRPESEFRAGHIPSAHSIPLEHLESRLATLPRAKNVVAYCRGPYCVLSVDAVEQLRASGIAAVRLADGFPEWKAAGLPIQVG